MVPYPAFDAILRDTLAEVEAAEAIDAEDARQAQDEVEQLRLRAAQLVSEQAGGPWLTGAPVQFAKDPSEGGTPTPTVDIRFPAPRYPVSSSRGEAQMPGEPVQEGRVHQPRRQGRRVTAAEARDR